MDAEKLLGNLVSGFLGNLVKKTVAGSNPSSPAVRTADQAVRSIARAAGLPATGGLGAPGTMGSAASLIGMLGLGMAGTQAMGGGSSKGPGLAALASLFGGGGQAPAPAPAMKAGGAYGPSTEKTAVRLIQAMIAAAHADGRLDDEERGRIMEKLAASGMTEDEKRFVTGEMDRPRSIQELTAGITDPTTKRMLFGLSLAAIKADTWEEFTYLEKLGDALALSAEDQKQLRESVGVQ